SEHGSLYALDPSTGAVIWRKLREGAVLAPVTVANGVVYVSSLAGLDAHDADNGEPLWAPADRVPTFSQPVVCDGAVYVTFADGGVVRFGLP
ncbi:MAG: PQQ-binding-like beta-propeller repeat protein, partial [Bryobacteraceae bacterium]